MNWDNSVNRDKTQIKRGDDIQREVGIQSKIGSIEGKEVSTHLKKLSRRFFTFDSIAT